MEHIPVLDYFQREHQLPLMQSWLHLWIDGCRVVNMVELMVALQIQLQQSYKNHFAKTYCVSNNKL